MHTFQFLVSLFTPLLFAFTAFNIDLRFFKVLEGEYFMFSDLIKNLGLIENKGTAK